jgi:hypothetical protein
MKGTLMTRFARFTAAVLLATGVAVAAESSAKPNTLTQTQIEDGWVLLFDGQTPFGWKVEDGVKVADGMLAVAGGAKGVTAATDTEFSAFDLQFEYKAAKAKGIKLVLNGKSYDLEAAPKDSQGGWMQAAVTVQGGEKDHRVAMTFASAPEPKAVQPKRGKKVAGPSRTTVGFSVPAGESLELRSIRLKPLGEESIFNGKDLSGWKEIPDQKAKFTVTPKGEINVKNGPGDLQSEGKWDDFVLQLDVFSNGDHLNSGIFYRAVAGTFWSGYELQIRNEWKGNESKKPRDEANEDRTKPVDIGTGGIYNRQASRKVVSNDREWFTATLVVHGKHMSAWINGYQTADFVDNKPPAESGRKGMFLGKGPISIQGHDPTTDLSFRKIRIAPIPRTEKVD